MFSLIVGPVDMFAAAVLVALFISGGIFFTSWITTRRSRQSVDNDFYLAKLKEANAQALAVHRDDNVKEVRFAELALKKEIEWKRIDANMITSHTSDTESQ